MSGLGRSLVLGSPRELGTVGLVSGLCGAYAAVLIMTSVFLVTVADEAGGGVAAVLGVVATVFIGIAVYVGGDRHRERRRHGARRPPLADRPPAAARRAGPVAARSRGPRRHPDRRRRGRWSAPRSAPSSPTCSASCSWSAGRCRTSPTRSPAPLLALPVLTMTPACAVAGWVGSRRILRVSPAAALSGSSGHTGPSSADVGRARHAGGADDRRRLGPAGAGRTHGRGRRDAGGVHRRVRRLGRGRHRAAGGRPVRHPLAGRDGQPAARHGAGRAGGRAQRRPGPAAHHPLDDGSGRRRHAGHDVLIGAPGPAAVGRLVGPVAGGRAAGAPDPLDDDGDHDRHRGDLGRHLGGRVRQHDVARRSSSAAARSGSCARSA